MRLYFACDLHGSEGTFLKFVNAARMKIYKADIIVASGDLTGKAFVPIIETSDGSYRADLMGSEEKVKSKEELEALTKRIRNIGYYYKIMPPTGYEELKTSKDLYMKTFSTLMNENLSRWITIAEERLRKTGVQCYMMPGNDDPAEIGEVIERSDYVVNPENKVLELGGREMISTGFSNPTPWNTPRECSESELGARIEKMAATLSNASNSIFNFHCPPYDSGLDSAPQLDKDLRPVVVTGELLKIPVGSKAVRQSIERYQPLLGLHGHIHEASGEARIGRTVCLNPGSEYQSSILRGYVIDFEKSGLKQWLRVEA